MIVVGTFCKLGSYNNIRHYFKFSTYFNQLRYRQKEEAESQNDPQRWQRFLSRPVKDCC